MFQLKPLILNAPAKGTIADISLDKDHPEQKIRAGNYLLDIKLRQNWDGTFSADKGYAMIITMAADKYFIAGRDFQISFSPTSGSQMVEFDYVEEGAFQRGKWIPGRRLNGDEISSRNGNVVRISNGSAIRKIKVYGLFPINACIAYLNEWINNHFNIFTEIL